MAFDPDKCSTCPRLLPACGGQLDPSLCNPLNAAPIDPDAGTPIAAATPESTAGLDANRDGMGVAASSIYGAWPST